MRGGGGEGGEGKGNREGEKGENRVRGCVTEVLSLDKCNLGDFISRDPANSSEDLRKVLNAISPIEETVQVS